MRVENASRCVEGAEPVRMPADFAPLVADGVPLDALRRAAALARRCDVAPVDALLRGGGVPEPRIYRALAAHLDLPFADGDLPVHPLARFPEAILTGLVPLGTGPVPTGYAWAPGGEVVGRLLRSGARPPDGFRITTPSVLRAATLRARAASVAAGAADGLARRMPHASFRSGFTRGQSLAVAAAAAALGAASVAWPAETALATLAALGALFLFTTAIRLAATLEAVPTRPARSEQRWPDATLPTYTLLVPLHREAAVVPKLLRAMIALDYPALCSKCTRKRSI